MSLEKFIKNTKVTGSSLSTVKQHFPSQYADRKKQYFNDETRLFTEQYAQYSSDYVEAQIQGLDPSEPFEYTTVHVRLANIVRSSSAITYEFDNYKNIDIAERQYTYIRKGAKIITMGSTWLCINPDNMSNVLGKAIIQRCDAVWNHLDFCGNVLHEPVCVDRLDMRGVDPDAQRAVMINAGYYQLKMQYNEYTSQLGNNSRIMVGENSFRISGYADFHREFTFDSEDAQMIVFRAMYEEPNLEIDDLTNYVSGGATFKWDMTISGTPTIAAGSTSVLTVTSKRTSEEHTETVTSTETYPISYLWTSSDESVATVDEYGAVQGISEGTARITCTLEQNENKSTYVDITVSGENTEPHVSFTSTTPETLRMFETVTLEANYYENGSAVNSAVVQYTFSGADENAYEATVSDNTVTIKCWGGSVQPLNVTAEYNGYETSFTVSLEGI